MVEPPPFKMPEAEVSLRLAFYLLAHHHAIGPVEVAIDGAQVRTLEEVHFAIEAFLTEEGCKCTEPATDWRGIYIHRSSGGSFRIHASPGQGDVVARLKDGRTLRVESKKGPLVATRSAREFPLLREALGQLLTVESVSETDILAVAVPHSPKFVELADRWRDAPLVRRSRIQIVTVDRQNQVHGLRL